MTPLLLYWLKANLFLCLFYGSYWLLLRNHTFLRLNRVYLLGTLLASFLLPLVQVPGLSLGWLWADEAPVTATVTAEAGYVVSATELTDSAPILPDWPKLLYWAVLAGAVVLSVRAGWRVGRVLWRIHQWPTASQPDHTLVYPPDSQTPTFSFFRYLVLNPADTQSETVRQHELGHIRQWHSVDVLLIELAQALCWPNPALWGYGRAIRETHEFLADRFATEQATTQRDDYARFLVSYAFDLPTDALTHPFSTNQTNFPSLKQRIQMIYKQHTQRRALWKYALILPVTTALLALTTAPEPTSDTSTGALATPGATAQVYVEGVISGKGSTPLPGAFVSVKGASSGATTDLKGHFQLTVPTSTVLTVNARGYQDMELTINPEDGDLVVFGDLRLTPKTAHAPETVSAASASVRVSGVVRASDNSPLPGATIEVKNGQRGTTTDVQGHFQLDAPAGSTLITRFVGFKPQTIPVATNISILNVNVVLDPASATTNVPKPVVEPYRITPSQQSEVFTVVQQVPTFPGGQAKLYRFLGQTLRYPAEAVKKNVSGKVFISFVVNADGRLDQIRVLKGIGAGCDEEAVRVVSLMPNWIPGKQNGRVVAVKYNLPIHFQLDKKPAKATGFNQTGTSANPDDQSQSTATASTSGKPTMTVKPLLRPLMGQEPLYVINGEEITKAEMDAIDPASIESISVWKSGPRLDAYGSKAQYGLVEITLKAK
ncbi:TonB family protein [Fibrella aestuarina BUZ 2]|uniref:TonB family protein n=1 Tax=Fibrella aestuarina BUZ 2 TaxID=1166018 RepID=I0KA86_9BACT|nr:M56 family metallopeptidase [Fibrella aestuarina]CCH01039.1 TonB family protein [Fibrella aestuarina BUZ 2]